MKSFNYRMYITCNVLLILALALMITNFILIICNTGSIVALFCSIAPPVIFSFLASRSQYNWMVEKGRKVECYIRTEDYESYCSLCLAYGYEFSEKEYATLQSKYGVYKHKGCK